MFRGLYRMLILVSTSNTRSGADAITGTLPFCRCWPISEG